MNNKLKNKLFCKKSKKVLKFIFQSFLLISIGIVLTITLRLFFFASFKIPTPSMEPAIISGDHVLVNKLIPGPRFFKNYDFLLNGGRPEIKRIKGIRSIKRNDILVFNFPYSNPYRLQLDMNVYYVKRCVAIPGDTFYIDNGMYRVKNVSDPLGFLDGQKDIARLQPHDFRPEIYHCYPYDEELNWNIKNFGPLYVPGKGDRILLTPQNYTLYKNLLEYETGKTVYRKSDHVFIGDSLITNYTFLTNYYFMAGELVWDSRDSRYWGLLPEDHIVGKAVLVWKSEDMHTGKFRKERFLKTIK